MKTVYWCLFGYLFCAFVGYSWLSFGVGLTPSELLVAMTQEPFVIFLFVPATGGLILIIIVFLLFLLVGAVCGLVVLGGAAGATFTKWKQKRLRQKNNSVVEDEDEEVEEDEDEEVEEDI